LFVTYFLLQGLLKKKDAAKIKRSWKECYDDCFDPKKPDIGAYSIRLDSRSR
jgi:hypothetical protein